MKFEKLRELVSDYPFFFSNIFEHLEPNVVLLRRQFTHWISKGYIIPLKRGFYTLREIDRRARFSPYFLATNLYRPSYVSLETALSYYGVIPEKTVAVTSVTTKKTGEFTNFYGRYIYHHIKTDLYSDYISKMDEFGNIFFIATLERSLVDFFYYRMASEKKISKDIFEQSYRFQNLENIDCKKLTTISSSFPKKTQDIVALFKKYVEEVA